MLAFAGFVMAAQVGTLLSSIIGSVRGLFRVCHERMETQGSKQANATEKDCLQRNIMTESSSHLS